MSKDKIIKALRQLNTDRSSSHWDDKTTNQAPHKPFLLLSILDGAECGWIDHPSIKLSSMLIETFYNYWDGIMGKERQTTVALPFFHLKSEPFWTLKYEDGMKPFAYSPSIGSLRRRVRCAILDDDLFGLLISRSGNKKIRSILLQTYFSENLLGQLAQIHQVNVEGFRYSNELDEFLREPFKKYHDVEDTAYTLQKKQQREYGFSLSIRKSYKNHCAICRAKVITQNGKSLVDGAHIIPWCESYNDDPRNGIALCKTHHWMFDSFLLSIRPDYTIRLSSWVKRNGENIDDTIEWDRKQIYMPEADKIRPSEVALEDHFSRFKSG